MAQNSEISAAIKAALEEWRVPGAAVSILRDGEALYRECFGVMSLEDGRPVEPASVFDIGSLTKTFNAAAVALLVEEGKLRWDDKVADLLPGFALADPWMTREVTLGDVLGHRVGQLQDSLTDYKSHFSREQIVAQMRYVTQRRPFRSEACYNNYGPTAAGVIVERLSGLSWEDFIHAHITGPLGLNETFASFELMPDPSAACDPHADFGDGEVVVFPHDEISAIGPAGSIVGSLRDMEAWMSIFAREGAHRDGQFLVPQTVAELLRPRSLFDRSSDMARGRFEANFVAYGYGWFSHDFHGHFVAEHSGSIMGFSVLGMVVPDERLSLVFLANMHLTPARSAARYILLDAFLGGPRKDWVAATRDFQAKQPDPPLIDGVPYPWRPTGRVDDTVPTRPLADYTGTYSHPGYGDVPVWLEDGQLVADLGGNVADLGHWHYDLFCAVPRDRGAWLDHPQVFAGFATDLSGRFTRLLVPTMGEFRLKENEDADPDTD